MVDNEALRLRALGDAQRQPLTPQQQMRIRYHDAVINNLTQDINEAKKGLTWKERWDRKDKLLIEGRIKPIK